MQKAIIHTQSEKPGLATAHTKKIDILQNRPKPPGSPLIVFYLPAVTGEGNFEWRANQFARKFARVPPGAAGPRLAC